MAEVRVHPDATGFTAMLGGLLQANLTADPGKGALVDRSTGSVVIQVTDTGEDVRLVLDGGVLDVSPDVGRPADLRLVGTADTIMGLSTTPLRFGLPDLLSSGGRQVLERWATAVVRGSGLQVHGLPRAAPLLRTVLSLLSVVS